MILLRQMQPQFRRIEGFILRTKQIDMAARNLIAYGFFSVMGKGDFFRIDI